MPIEDHFLCGLCCLLRKVVADAADRKVAAVMEKAAVEFERQFTKARAAQEAPTNAMGCVASQERAELMPGSTSFASTAAPTPVSAEKAETAAEKAAAEKAAAAYTLAGGEAAAKNVGQAQALTNAAQQFGQQFEQTTPMLVMPFSVFKAQGRIMKSTKVWRDQALAAGSLVVHEEGL